MLKYLSLVLLLACSCFAQNCDYSQQLLYNGACVNKSCLTDKLSRFQLTVNFGQEVTGNQGKLSQGVQYLVTAQSDSNGLYYLVQIRYADNPQSQILSDPTNCVDYRIYSTKNSYNIDPTRQFLTAQNDGAVPTWPVPSYSYVPNVAAQIQFTIREKELESNCVNLAGSGVVQFNCYFEMAFLVRSITQVSYYFSISAIINTQATTNTLPPAQFVKLVQVDQCPGAVATSSSSAPQNTSCSLNINVGSSLLYCDTSACANTANTPFFTLFLNRQFYMKHLIQDQGFSNWYINNPAISFQSLQLMMQLQSGQINTVVHNKGYNIYQLAVPIVAQNVLISASGTLSQSSTRRFLADTTSRPAVIHDSKYTGKIEVDSSSSQSVYSTSNSALLQAMLVLILICLY